MYDKNFLDKYGGKLTGRGCRIMVREYRRRYRMLGDGKILDAGFGSGLFLEAHPEGVEVWGIDIIKDAVEYLDAKGFNVKQSSVTDIPFEDESCDGIHCAFVIDHLRVEEVDKMAREFHRVLKPGGRVVIVADHHRIVWNSPYHFRPYKIKTIRNLFKYHGFKSIKAENLGLFKGLGLVPQPFYYFIQRLIGRIFVHSSLVLGEKI